MLRSVRSLLLLAAICAAVLLDGSHRAVAQWPTVSAIERQPLQASVKRLSEAMKMAGEEFPAAIREQLDRLNASLDDATVTTGIQELLDPFCIAAVQINPESRVHCVAGPATASLLEKGWRTFLVKIVNDGGVTAALRCTSPQSQPMMIGSSSKANPDIVITPAEAERRWLEIELIDREPMRRTLSGLRLEYRIVQLYSRDAGKREATIQFDVGQGTQDLGFRNELPILFDCAPSKEIELAIEDWDGEPTTCSLLIRDRLGRVYPNQSRRSPPDFYFHPQVYRSTGESIRLPPGEYHITATRGPEYLATELDLTVTREIDDRQIVPIRLQRWIHLAKQNWISGDHHVHAAGCAHFENPTQGVSPSDMMRHIIGEDLNVGCVLSWGPCWYHQKQFFEGQVSNLSRSNYVMRYDVEVSGFPSSHAGHLCLLNLTEDDYPNTKSIEEWPTWTIPILKWGQSQGGVVGYSHSGWGLSLPDYLPNGQRGLMPKMWGGAASPSLSKAADKLPDYAMPPFDGIGANEYIVAVANDACDFISTVDTPAVWELNIWYHTLNCGFRTRISGETDFPCIYGDRVGLGRVYVAAKDVRDPYNFRNWVEGIRDGRSYVTDGLSHATHFSINNVEMGMEGDSGRVSQVEIDSASALQIESHIAALLPEKQTLEGHLFREFRLDEKPYWHLERARMGDSRNVPVELIVNGESVARQEIIANGTIHKLQWTHRFEKSSWVAIRIFPSLHTNPIFVEVAGDPIRASRQSAQWCRDAVDVCWAKKLPLIRESERAEAKTAYDRARQAYDQIISQCKTDK